jgi:hypothetical protein
MEIAKKRPEHASALNKLSTDYGIIAETLIMVSDKSMDSQEKIKFLEQAKDREAECISRIGDFAASPG